MAELATESSSWIHADGWECRRERWSRTIEVLRHHRESMLEKFEFYKFFKINLITDTQASSLYALCWFAAVIWWIPSPEWTQATLALSSGTGSI